MDNSRREAQRIKKEQDNETIEKLISEIRPIICKIPDSYKQWDQKKTVEFKEFHSFVTKKINMQRIKLEDIIHARQKVTQWYGK